MYQAHRCTDSKGVSHFIDLTLYIFDDKKRKLEDEEFVGKTITVDRLIPYVSIAVDPMVVPPSEDTVSNEMVETKETRE